MPRKPQNETEKLKREISARWPLVQSDAVAHAQLEYILAEAGLLAKPRRKQSDNQKLLPLEVTPHE